MRVIPPSPAVSIHPETTHQRASRVAAHELIACAYALNAALLNFVVAHDPEISKELVELDVVQKRLIAAVKNLLEPVYREPEEALAHGIAFGLWFAGKPELIREFSESTRRHVWTTRLPGREEILKAAANVL